jgi:PHP family Zn ribbon phosphoesterase
MIGDGLHNEPDGRWISVEYKKVCKALGHIKPKPRNNAGIDEQMKIRVEAVACTKCGGTLKQVRSGSMRAACAGCGAKFQLLKRAKR